MSNQRPTRRGFFAIGTAVVAVLGLCAHAFAWARSLIPNVQYQPPKKRKLGPPKQFPKGKTYLADLKIFVIRDDLGLRALSAVCPHLGCTVGTQGEGYHCPCHGSKFDATGKNGSGPAPRPLAWHPLTLSGSGALVVDLGAEVSADAALQTKGGGS